MIKSVGYKGIMQQLVAESNRLNAIKSVTSGLINWTVMVLILNEEVVCSVK